VDLQKIHVDFLLIDMKLQKIHVDLLLIDMDFLRIHIDFLSVREEKQPSESEELSKLLSKFAV
jgi:hypothetical protein